MATDYSKYKKTLGGMTKSSSLLSASVIDVLSNACYVVSALDKAPSNGNNVGDVTIVSSKIGENDSLISRTSYYWTGNTWAAMDGNYNAENVYFNEDIQCVGPWLSVGNVTKTKTGVTTIQAKGKNVKDVFDAIFFQDQDNASISQPSITLTVTNGTDEVGKPVYPKYKATFSPGSYTYGSLDSAGNWSSGTGVSAETLSAVLSGVTAISSIVSLASGTEYTSQTSVVYADANVSSFVISGYVKYTKGDDVCTAAHKKSSTKTPIAAGSKVGTAKLVAGYRKPFWGYGTTLLNPASINSMFIRTSLTNSGTSAKGLPAGEGNQFTLPVGAMWVMFACDKATGYSSISVLDKKSNLEVKGFTKIEVNVDGYNGYASKPYNVFYKSWEDPIGSEMKLVMSWA